MCLSWVSVTFVMVCLISACRPNSVVGLWEMEIPKPWQAAARKEGIKSLSVGLYFKNDHTFQMGYRADYDSLAMYGTYQLRDRELTLYFDDPQQAMFGDKAGEWRLQVSEDFQTIWQPGPLRAKFTRKR